MIAARVAGVPRPCSLSASFSCLVVDQLAGRLHRPEQACPRCRASAGVVSPRRTDGSCGPLSPGRNSGRSCSSSFLSSSLRG